MSTTIEPKPIFPPRLDDARAISHFDTETSRLFRELVADHDHLTLRLEQADRHIRGLQEIVERHAGAAAPLVNLNFDGAASFAKSGDLIEVDGKVYRVGKVKS